MKICMIVRNACVRDARVLREAGTLASAGHDVTVIATAEPGVPDAEERDGFRIRRVEPVPAWVRRLVRRPVIATQSEPATTAAQAGRGRRPSSLIAFRDRLVTRQLAGAAHAVPADVYHAHDLNTLESALRAAHARGARTVYDAHELYPELSGFSPAERARWARIERRLIGRADRVVTVSEGIAAELVRRYGIEAPLVLLNCPPRPAVPPDAGRSPLAAIRGDGRALVLYAGAMHPNRGLEALVDAAERAKGWRLVMMGWGRLESELRRRAPSVTFLPPVPPEEIVAASAGADVGVIPYPPVGLNNALSMPNKLFDYVHAGLAVAASDLVQLRRFIEHHAIGVTFTPGDPASIAEVIDGLVADPSRLAGLREATQAAAAACDWNVEKHKLLSLYAGL